MHAMHVHGTCLPSGIPCCSIQYTPSTSNMHTGQADLDGLQQAPKGFVRLPSLRLGLDLVQKHAGHACCAKGSSKARRRGAWRPRRGDLLLLLLLRALLTVPLDCRICQAGT